MMFLTQETDTPARSMQQEIPPIAFVINKANGGPSRFEWYDSREPRIGVESKKADGRPRIIQGTPEEAKLLNGIKGQTVQMHCHEFEMDPCLFVGSLVDEWETQNRLARATSRKARRSTQ